MLILDLFCGAGGAAVGYHRAGFNVIGVDLHPQPHYPFTFWQADAMEILDELAMGVAYAVHAVHASPPCQHYSDLAHRNGNRDDHPDLIAQVRARLQAARLPYIIENVEGAPLVRPVWLCGTMFAGLRVLRHRGFESSLPLTAPPHGHHPLCYTRDRRKNHYGRLDPWTAFVHVNGGGNAPVAAKLDAMGIDWPMTGREVNEAIPPAYTEWVGRQLIEQIAT